MKVYNSARIVCWNNSGSCVTEQTLLPTSQFEGYLAVKELRFIDAL